MWLIQLYYLIFRNVWTYMGSVVLVSILGGSLYAAAVTLVKGLMKK